MKQSSLYTLVCAVIVLCIVSHFSKGLQISYTGENAYIPGEHTQVAKDPHITEPQHALYKEPLVASAQAPQYVDNQREFYACEYQLEVLQDDVVMYDKGRIVHVFSRKLHPDCTLFQIIDLDNQ